MTRWAYLAVLAVLLNGPDVPKTYGFRSPTPGLAGASIPNNTIDGHTGDAHSGDWHPNGSEPETPPSVLVSVSQAAPGSKPIPLKSSSRLEIVRYISGEFVHADKALPGARKGFRIAVGKPLDEKSLKYALANTGIAVNPGDTVQITRIEFREKEIAIDLNGGSARHFHLRDHLQVGIGGAPTPVTTTSSETGTEQRLGATLILDYGRPLPDMSPDDVKRDLSPVLEFEQEKSAAVNWVDTLPLEYKQAIQDGHAAVGMNHDMVIAALGRPDHKVREKNDQGDETEDWIYGTPPSKTIFVTFIGDKVTRVREFN
ncbi:MAG: hypothetical protein WAK91_15090 [Candidatus Acidiferrales bacterium]|jgi:hypothetical protein